MLLRVDADHETGDIYNSPSDTDVALTDQDTSVMSRLSKSIASYHSLKTAIKKLVSLQSKDKIKLLFILTKDTDTSQSAKKCRTFKESARVLNKHENTKQHS